jgi:NTE family protein
VTRRGTSALVLGGGGIRGIAWELGILHGLAQAGVDLTDADVVVGTCAGSIVCAQVTNAVPIAELYTGRLEPSDTELGGRFPRRGP